MQHISTFTNKAQLKKGSRSCVQHTEIPEAIEKLFLAFGYAYQTAWTTTFTDMNGLDFCKRLWANALNIFDDEAIYKAMEKTLINFPTFPPKVGQFRQIVLDEQRLLDEKKPSHHPRVELKPSSKKTAQYWLNKMRANLK